MGKSKTFQEEINKARDETHMALDNFWDNLQGSEEDQVTLHLEKLENNISEASLKALFAHCEKNCPESTPLLLEQQELRKRVKGGDRPGSEGPGFTGQNPGPEQDFKQEGSHNMSPDDSERARKPEESFCQWVLRLFKSMLRRLQKTWQDVLAWVQEKLAPFLSAVKSIWSQIEKFCSDVIQSLLSFFGA
ncbi:PREDICTED: interleukin-32 [Miniopterus natalensis]|uniref:interleukin-32 n=1 Tax=Miniopterus natalensis TaxID=291302 RepID=UPI0007A72F32|nr:PREDICTED: interleukin-32 [Miniopterus natalensis]XP_016066905.1 PREDICTED: interleukin-32 [Miniopterus natalensis]